MSAISRNRRQIKLYVASVVVIALLVSAAANIFIAEFYATYKVATLYAIPSLLLIVVVLSYELIASEGMSRELNVDFVFTFDEENRSFLDISGHAPSIHSRVGWDALSDEYRNHLVTLNNSNDYFDSDLSRFLDSVTQTYLIMIVVRNTGYGRDDYKKVTHDELPSFLSSNKKILDMGDDDSLFKIPSYVQIERLTEDKPFLKFGSRYGALTISWTHSYASGVHLSRPFVISELHEEPDSYHDLEIHIKCELKLKHWRMMSDKADEFSQWTNEIFTKLNDASWKESEKRLKLYLLSQLFIAHSDDVPNDLEENDSEH